MLLLYFPHLLIPALPAFCNPHLFCLLAHPFPSLVSFPELHHLRNASLWPPHAFTQLISFPLVSVTKRHYTEVHFCPLSYSLLGFWSWHNCCQTVVWHGTSPVIGTLHIVIMDAVDEKPIIEGRLKKNEGNKFRANVLFFLLLILDSEWWGRVWCLLWCSCRDWCRADHLCVPWDRGGAHAALAGHLIATENRKKLQSNMCCWLDNW